jgi:hypothetical protein
MSAGVHLRNNLGSELSGNGFTDPVWSDCPIDSIRAGTVQGIIVEPNLAEYDSTATTVQNNCGLPTFEGDCTVDGIATAGGGVALFGTTDDEEASIQFCGNASAPFVIPADSSTGKKMWFECEIKKSLITDSLGGFFIGLTSEGAAVANFMADGGADFATADLLGFWNDETDDSVGSHVHVVTQKGSAAFDTIIDTVDTLVADTYVRLGFVYDPGAGDKKKIKFYVNGLPQTTCVGEDSGDATVYLGDTTNFPGGEEMAPAVAIKMASGDDMTATVRKLRCVQLL